VRLWSVKTGELLGPALHHADWAMEVAFSPNGTSIAVAGWDGPGVRLWTVARPFRGDLEDAELWLQVLTWMEMDANGVLGQLDRATWQARRAQLGKVAAKTIKDLHTGGDRVPLHDHKIIFGQMDGNYKLKESHARTTRQSSPSSSFVSGDRSMAQP
jgi:hypothetical protein